MAEQQRIRSAYFDEGMSIASIAQEYGIDRKTARKYITKENWNEPVESVSIGRPTVIVPFLETIEQWLTEDKHRRRKQRHTARRVFDRLVAECGYEGSYRTVATHVATIRAHVYQEHEPALPLQHIPGEAQADFGQADYFERGKRVSGSYVTLSFPSSNAGFTQLEPGENQECLFEALIALFEGIGGVPTRIWLDNASTMVAKVLKGGGRELTDRFRRFQEHFGFAVAFCNRGRGNEKGNVENKVGYLRRNLFVPEPEFDTLDEYNTALLARCRDDLDRSHYRKEATIEALFGADQAALLPLPRIPFDPAHYKTVTADAYGVISLEGGKHRYSSAPKFAKSRVTAKITAQTVSILDESRRPVVTHQRIYGQTHEERMEWLPYLTQLARKPAALKYTPVYEMMPEVLQEWIMAQPREDVGTALRLLASLSELSGVDTACAAVADSLNAGITDSDSLVALHDRITRFAAVLPEPVQTKSVIADPAVSFRPQRYDALFLQGSAS